MVFKIFFFMLSKSMCKSGNESTNLLVILFFDRVFFTNFVISSVISFGTASAVYVNFIMILKDTSMSIINVSNMMPAMI